MNIPAVNTFDFKTTAFKADVGTTNKQDTNSSPVKQDDDINNKHRKGHFVTQAFIIPPAILMAINGMGGALGWLLGGSASEALVQRLLEKRPVSIKENPLNIFSYLRAVAMKAKNIIKKI